MEKIDSKKLAQRLILLAFVVNFSSACSVNWSDGMLIGNEAQRLYNERLKIKSRSTDLDKLDGTDRAALQDFLDKMK